MNGTATIDIDAGLCTPNEARAKLGLPPLGSLFKTKGTAAIATLNSAQRTSNEVRRELGLPGIAGGQQ
jgi:hypothetical protein